MTGCLSSSGSTATMLSLESSPSHANVHSRLQKSGCEGHALEYAEDSRSPTKGSSHAASDAPSFAR
eukprot:scaffold30769_cov71-Phaeocystis_antarctica.AAC.3